MLNIKPEYIVSVYEGTERGLLMSCYSMTPTQAPRKFSGVTRTYMFSMNLVFYEFNENEFRGRRHKLK